MKIGFVTTDWNEGYPETSGWHRCWVPMKALEAQGHDVTIGRTLKASRFGWAVVNPVDQTTEVPDVLVVQRWMDAEVPHAVRWAKRRGQLVLADIDDWLFGLHRENIATRTLAANDPRMVGLAHYADALRAVDGVICSTPWLAEQVGKRFNRNVAVVRNAIDLKAWPRRFHRELIDQSAPGWTGAVHWRSRDLETLKGIIGQVLDRHATSFVHVGFDGDFVEGMEVPLVHERLGIDADRVVSVRGVATPAWPRRVTESPIGVGVVPLSDHPFNRAKSALKGMEYAAAGIPFVAADLPEYRWLRDEHGIGRVARRPKDWLRHLNELVSDPGARAADRGQNWAGLADLDIDARVGDWVDAIWRLAEGACTDGDRRVTLPAS